MIKSNHMADTVGHCENCLYNILTEIEADGSIEQKEAIRDSLSSLETLYFLLQEEE